jgi:hypothetical protein
MPLYFGLPVTYQEAFRLFGLDFEQAKCEIMEKYKLRENNYMECHFVDYANNFFKEKNMEIRAFYTDKGQCIVGYKIENTSVFERKFVKASDFMNILEKLTTEFWCEIQLTHCEENFNKITLEHMEDEPEIVEGFERFELYIIEFHH